MRPGRKWTRNKAAPPFCDENNPSLAPRLRTEKSRRHSANRNSNGRFRFKSLPRLLLEFPASPGEASQTTAASPGSHHVSGVTGVNSWAHQELDVSSLFEQRPAHLGHGVRRIGPR